MREKFRLNEAAVHPVKIEHTRAHLTKNGTEETGKYENSVYYASKRLYWDRVIMYWTGGENK